MTKKTDTPAIRFKGFSDTWEQSKVTEIGKIYIGLVTTMTKHYTDEGTLLIRNSDIKDGKFEFGDNPIHLEKLFAEKNETRMHQIGDVITVHTGDVGTSAVITENEAKSIGFATIVTRPNPKIIDSNYLCSFLNTDKHKKWAVSISTGDGRTNYNLGDYFELVVPVPSIAEQKKIAAYIQNLNRLITLHQRKYEKLHNIKKSMLEKMFPKNGSNVPEIRFKGFTEAWEQRKAKDLCSISTGKSNTQDRVDDGIYPFYVRSPIVEHSNRYLFDEEAVLTVGDGVGTGKVFHYVNGKYDLHQRVYRMFDFSEEITAKYFYYYFSNHFYDRVMAMTAKTSVDSVRYEMIADMDIALPKVKEQMAISDYFERLDNLITLHQRELEKLQNIKKSMLEKMFV